MVIFYAEQIFKDTGSKSPATYTIIVGILQTTMTIITSLLVDHLGRKILLLFSTIVMSICLIIIGLYFHLKENGAATETTSCWMPLLGVVFFTMGYAIGLGPIPWVIFGEVLDPAIKAYAGSIAVSINWLATAIVAFSFKPIKDLIGVPFTFWAFSMLCVPIFLFIYFVVLETKGKSLKEIQDILAGKKKNNRTDLSWE